MDSGALAVAVQSNHEVVACGREQTGGSDDEFAVARLLSSGSLDTGFSSDGRATVDFSSRLDDCYAVAIDSGKIVLGGVENIIGPGDVALARLTSGGHLDTSFGSGGRTTTSLSSGLDEATGVAVDGSGRIVASAAKNVFGKTRFAVLRYLGNGHLDQSFGTGGITTTKVNRDAFPNGLALDGGRIVLAGQIPAPAAPRCSASPATWRSPEPRTRLRETERSRDRATFRSAPGLKLPPILFPT